MKIKISNYEVLENGEVQKYEWKLIMAHKIQYTHF